MRAWASRSADIARSGRRHVFSSLRIRNYRVYFVGQVISRMGTWMQRFAQSWLVYELSNNATVVGVAVALQSVPSLFAGPYSGLVADRFDKRRLMIGLQSMMAVLAIVLGVLTVTHVVQLWEIFLLAFLLGVNEAFEVPARQVFVFELVGPEHLQNAVGLNSVLNSIARAAGPAMGAVLVATIGLGTCFLVNGLSFVAVIASLIVIDTAALHPAHLSKRARGQVREGLLYVRRSPELWAPLTMMALIGMLAWEFQTVMPAMASQVLHGGATAYGLITAAQGFGSIFGGLAAASARKTSKRLLVGEAVAFGVAMALAASAPTLDTELVLIFVVGFTATALAATGNTTIQLNSDPRMRGRVMSLWLVAFQGSTPIGGPLAGFVAHAAGARAALAMGAAACFGAAGLGVLAKGWRDRPVSPVSADEALLSDMDAEVPVEALATPADEDSR